MNSLIDLRKSNMRNLIILFSFFICLPVSAQLQFDYPITEIEPTELIATYSLNFQQDSTNLHFIREEQMLLLLGQSVSKFLSSNFYTFDTIMRGLTSTSELQNLLSDKKRPLPMSAFMYQIFKKYPTGKITTIEHVTATGTFKYEENMWLFNWQLSGDTATISSYKAQKATCTFGGRSWIAWFSPEIPYSDGPYKFNGLPGLIINIHDTHNHYVFELETIERPNNTLMIDLKEKDFIETDKQGFFRAKDAFRNDIVSRAKEAGLGSEAQQIAARNMAMKNNPIELKRK